MNAYITLIGPGFYVLVKKERGVVFEKWVTNTPAWPPADAEYFMDQSEVAAYDFDIVIEVGAENDTVA